ncbi:TPR-like protein [Dendrothele bispora CBS 962.96]|uniref:TPR-like protein n=1 Tax=Dendrothele bispora (strain CBS 962.96) TaxID=1314807 RepID=A0A4S8KYP0_DENBC|nr:TPR-like protein [Dendrothele bispora CBS 962.96]
MSEPDNLLEGPVVTLAAADVEEMVTQSTSGYHEDDELHMAIRMSLEEPDAETTGDIMGDNMPIDKEEQAELDQALFLSNLPPDMCDEQLAELHQARMNGANSAQDALDLLYSAKQLLELVLAPDGSDLKASLIEVLSEGKVGELEHSAVQLMKHFEQSGDLTTIDNAVQLMEEVIRFTPDGHTRKAGSLDNLSNALSFQFDRLGKLRDLENAIHFSQLAVDLTPDGHAAKAGQLNNLGNAFQSRFDCLGELRDVENAIHVIRLAVDLTPDGHADKASRLNNLGNAFCHRFERLGKLEDIENAIHVQQQAVDLTPDGHADKARVLSNLSNAFSRRFEHLGKLGDIENAIHVKKQAVDLTPDGHADKAKLLTNLSGAFCLRFEHLGKLGDIEHAIHVQQQAVDLTPDGHADKARLLNNLGSILQSQFERLGNLGDIQNAIHVDQQAVDLTPDGHADKAKFLSTLGNAFKSQFDHLGKLGDIENAIHVMKQAVDLTPDGHAEKASRLNSLGSALQSQFERLGKLGDIENAILIKQQAVDLTSDGHADKAARLSSLGGVLQSRFEYLGKLRDIENAILANQQAVDLTPDGHAAKAARLSNLGIAFQSRFKHLGKLGDIENAILANQQAVDLTPDGHADKAALLSNLGIAFWNRFDLLRELRDIENCIFVEQQAVNLTPDGHADKAARLNNLGIAFWSRFKNYVELRDIENAILITQQAQHGSTTSGLLSMIHDRFEHLGELGDIENAILVEQQAVDLTPDGHVSKAAWLNNLGNAFKSRFDHLGELRDIENAILVKQQAVDLTPDGHVRKAEMLKTLGDAFRGRFGCSGEPRDIMEASVAYKQATENTSSHPFSRYDATRRWADLCSKHQSPSSALDAYTVVMEIIPQLAWTINAAAAMAISVGDLPKAVEWLEEGRSVIWKQILQLHTPLDELRQQCPDIADDLLRVSLDLANAGTSSFRDNGSEINHKDAEEEAQHHRRLAAKYEGLLQQVRELDDFGSFLRPKKFSELAPAARNGPVVIINVHESGCGALVVCPSTDVIHVPLPMISSGEAAKMHSDLISLLNAYYPRGRNPSQNSVNDEASIFDLNIIGEILRKLWVFVAQPILSAVEGILYENSHDSLAHITWCATGAFAFLPLHAAGIYGCDDPTKNMDISDFVVSSYTTTLTAMLSSISKPKQNPTKTPSVLIVSQLGTEATPLTWTVKEVEVIQHYISPGHTCHLSNELATVGAVLGEMSKHEIIHFACHGIQDMQNPLNSAFTLCDGRLELNTLMKLSLKNAELAVLSACETATGDERLPEEAVHLAAGMLAIGYPSVIATMWSIWDPDAPLIADKLYGNLLGHCDNSASQKANLTPAYALHEAVKHLRKEVDSDPPDDCVGLTVEETMESYDVHGKVKRHPHGHSGAGYSQEDPIDNLEHGSSSGLEAEESEWEEVETIHDDKFAAPPVKVPCVVDPFQD